MRKISFLFFTLIILFSSCEQDETNVLTAEFITPTDNENVYKNTNVSIEVNVSSDVSEISLIELYIDNKLSTTNTGTTKSWQWNTTQVALGTYSIEIKATDLLGNSNSSLININVINNIIDFNDTLVYGTMKDIDGNEYKTIQIGTQTWMAEDLRTSRYRNGSAIGSTLNYDWYAVDSYKNLAPEGWHIPTAKEWTTLINYLGGYWVAGSKLREKGNIHWKDADTNTVSNSSGFTALPINSKGETAYYWSASENSDDISKAWGYFIKSGYVEESDYPDKSLSFFVRCIKD